MTDELGEMTAIVDAMRVRGVKRLVGKLPSGRPFEVELYEQKNPPTPPPMPPLIDENDVIGEPQSSDEERRRKMSERLQFGSS